jgi:hypothetical protein
VCPNAADRRKSANSEVKHVKFRTTGKPFFTAFLISSAALSTLGMAAQSSPVVWIAPSLHRVGMADAAAGGTKASLSAARGEYESFQIIVRQG